MLEGTTLSEGRGTTRPLELFGAPDLDARQLLANMRALAPDWLAGCRLRPCWFEPTFHKHAGKLCAGMQIHVDDPGYDHSKFRPWRLVALAFKAIRAIRPDYPLWRDFPYEYETTRLAIDLINGGRRCANGSTTRPRRRATSTSSRGATRTHGNPRSEPMKLRPLRAAGARSGARRRGSEVGDARRDADRAPLHDRGARRESLGLAPAP